MSGLLLIVIGIIAISILLILITTVIVWKKQKEGDYEEPNYQTFFILGICFLPMGLIFIILIGPGFIAFTGLGLFYLIIGLANKSKWKKV
jgi:hypothetical protein